MAYLQNFTWNYPHKKKFEDKDIINELFIFIHPIVYDKVIKEKWIHQYRRVSTMKLDILKAVILSDICNDYIHGHINPKFFEIKRDYYMAICAALNLDIVDDYYCIMGIFRGFLGKTYVTISQPSVLTRSFQSRQQYCVTEELVKLAEEIKKSGLPMRSFDPKKFKGKIGQCTFYKFEGKFYDSCHQIIKEHGIPDSWTEGYRKYWGHLMKTVDRQMIWTSDLELNCEVNDPESLRKIEELMKDQLGKQFDKRSKDEEPVYVEHTTKINRENCQQILDHLRNEYGAKCLYSKIQRQMFTLNCILAHTDENGIMTQKYYESEHGRVYQRGYNLQGLPSEIREDILSDYACVDMKAATFSILSNYAMKQGIPAEEIKTLTEFSKDPDSFRKKIYTALQADDKHLKREYVKKCLNAMAFGANMNEYRVVRDICNGTRYTVCARFDGWHTSSTPPNMAANPIVKSLGYEIRNLTKKLVKKNTKKGKLYNYKKQPLQLKGERRSLGKKLVHIYQGIESVILEALYSYEIDGQRLIDTDTGVGLLLHDGIYIRKDLLAKIDEAGGFSSYIKEKFDYDIRFSLE